MTTALTPATSAGTAVAWQETTGFPDVCGPTGLTLPDDLGYDDWVALGGPLLGAARASMWWVGDWIRHGQAAYGQKYTVALDLTGLAYQTLRHAVMVCEALPAFMRRTGLSFTHHQIVVQQVPDRAEWAGWLDRCESEGLTSDELRTEIRAARAVDAPSEDVPAVPRPVRLMVPRDVAVSVLPVLSRVAAGLGGVERESLSALVELLEKEAA